MSEKEKTIVKVTWGSDWKAYVKKNDLGAYAEIDWGGGKEISIQFNTDAINDLIHYEENIGKDENELAFYKAILAEMIEVEGGNTLDIEEAEEPSRPEVEWEDGINTDEVDNNNYYLLQENHFEDLNFLKELVDEHDASIRGMEDIYVKWYSQFGEWEKVVEKLQHRIANIEEWVNSFEKEQEKQGERIYHLERRQDHHTKQISNLEHDMERLWQKIGEISRRW